jgi:hypothetical protein
MVYHKLLTQIFRRGTACIRLALTLMLLAGLAAIIPAAPTSSFTHAGAAADIANNHAYLLLGVDAAGQHSDPSNRVGEFGFGLTPGAPAP